MVPRDGRRRARRSSSRDAADDPQAAAHPFVRATGIRAYAGVPVRREDGTLYRHAVLPEPLSRSRSSASATCATSTCSRAWRRERLEAASDARRTGGAPRSRPPPARRCWPRSTRARTTPPSTPRPCSSWRSRWPSELGLDGRGGHLGRPGRAAARHRQGRRARRDPAQAGRADRAGVGGHARAPGDRRADRRARSARSRTSRPAVRAEHERWDGGGYPDGLAGEDVPLASRICFVCDAWHAMTSDRPYRRALTTDAGARGAAPQRGHAVLPRSRSPRSSACSTAAAPAGRGARAARRARGAAAGAPRPAARGRAAGADHDLQHRRGRAPLRGRARHRRASEACRVLHAAGVSISRWEPRARPHAHARQRRRAQPGRGAPPGERDVDAHRARPHARAARRART